MMFVCIVSVTAMAFGLASPWVICEIPNFGWWRTWLVASIVGFLAAFWFSNKMMRTAGNIDAVLGAFSLFWIQVFSFAVFVASFAAKAYSLQKRG